MSTDSTLDAATIRELLTKLGRRLEAEGIEGRFFIVGGAAMALAINTRRVTRDIDAVFEPKQKIYAAARAMAHEHGLPDDWLNDGVKRLLPDLQQPQVGTTFSTPGLHVGVAQPEYLFAMKAMAARQDADGEDLIALAKLIGLRTPAEALDLVERFYSSARISPKTQLIVEDAIAQAW